MKIKENGKFIIQSSKLNGAIVENILMLLYLKDYSISDLLYQIKNQIKKWEH